MHRPREHGGPVRRGRSAERLGNGGFGWTCRSGAVREEVTVATLAAESTRTVVADIGDGEEERVGATRARSLARAGVGHLDSVTHP